MRLALLAALAPLAWLLVPACGTDAVGVESCRSIETARCKMAPNCNVDLSQPVHRGSPGTDIDACIQFYNDQCLHGLAAQSDPGTIAVNACIGDINSGNCDYVVNPQHAPNCAFLTNIADAGPDGADASDASTPCPSGCSDFGIQFCNGNHFCVCQSALATPPSNCSSSTVTATGAPYCCQ